MARAHLLKFPAMNYPIWDIPLLGGGLLIAGVAIVHVFISHFAIGGGLFLVLTEMKGHREGDRRIIEYVRFHSRFFILLTLVMGALTGVGIWFTIALVQPDGTSTLIHTFVWIWALEWVFFAVEIAAAFVYYYGWDRLDRRTHLTVGWIYFGAAWISLFLVNSILSFMLTPGDWLETHNIQDAFFNASFLPSTFVRTCVTIALAGLYALMTAALQRDEDLRAKMIRYAARWLVPAFLLLPIGGTLVPRGHPQRCARAVAGGVPRAAGVPPRERGHLGTHLRLRHVRRRPSAPALLSGHRPRPADDGPGGDRLFRVRA